MKNLLEQYAGYNAWANRRLLDVVQSLSSAQQHQTIASSFDSLYKTVYHMLYAENVWLQRLQIISKGPDGDPYEGSMQALSAAMMQSDQQLMNWLYKTDEGTLSREWAYHNLKGMPFRDRVFLILMHVFNHGTYHRGQIVTMLRQLGCEQIPSTDFIAWARTADK